MIGSRPSIPLLLPRGSIVIEENISYSHLNEGTKTLDTHSLGLFGSSTRTVLRHGLVLVHTHTANLKSSHTSSLENWNSQ